jgi:hypothetical protein
MFQLFLAALLAVQTTPPQPPSRPGDIHVTVPNGWIEEYTTTTNILLTHSTGASLQITKITTNQQLDQYAHDTADRIANPLGFATIGDPRHFSNSDLELIEFQIRGNRLSNRRRILYRVVRNSTGIFNIIYESSEGQFDTLLSEVQSIASSMELTPLPSGRRTR